MHELSIAMSILDSVGSTCREHGFVSVDRVRVQVGRASGVQTSALLFAFDTAKSGTIAERAVLQIDEIPVAGQCRDCGSQFTAEESYVLSCPRCGGTRFQIVTGRELQIVELEVDE